MIQNKLATDLVPISDGFNPSLLATDQNNPSLKFSDATFSGGFKFVANSVAERLATDFAAFSDGFRPSLIASFLAVLSLVLSLILCGGVVTVCFGGELVPASALYSQVLARVDNYRQALQMAHLTRVHCPEGEAPLIICRQRKDG